MVTCDVKFDSLNGIYYSGQILSGYIELTNDKIRNIRGISLKIEGCAKCKWTESEGSGKTRRTVTYSGREDYLNTFSYLIGSRDVSQIVLQPGVHQFNFSGQLPQQLPTSFESKYGYIRYQLKIEIERAWKLDINFNFAFTVIRINDLNFENFSLRLPLKQEISKSFFFGLSSKVLFLEAEIPFSGFVCGQTVPISIRINNESSVDVEEIKVSLKKVIHYNSQTPRRKTRERIESAAEVRHEGVKSKCKGYVNSQLTIPPVAPTNIGYCNVLQVSYEIHIVGKVGGIHRSPVLKLPVTIGTVPFQTLNSGYVANMAAMDRSIMPSTSYAPAYEAPSASAPALDQTSQDLPPPSYSQAMGMTSTDNDFDEGLDDQKPFNPMYPVFDFANTNANASAQPPPSYGFSMMQQSDQEKRLF